MSTLSITDEESLVVLAQAIEAEQIILEAFQLSNGETVALQNEALSVEAQAKIFESSVAAYADTLARDWKQAVQAYDQDEGSAVSTSLENAEGLIAKVETFKNDLLNEQNGSSPAATKGKKTAPAPKKKS